MSYLESSCGPVITSDMNYREKIDKWCELRRGNAADLARALGRDQAAISKFRKDRKRKLTIEEAFKVARLMGVTLDWLIDANASWPPEQASEERALDEGEAEILRFARTMRRRVSVDELLDRMALTGLTRALSTPPQFSAGSEEEIESIDEDQRREPKPKRRG